MRRRLRPRWRRRLRQRGTPVLGRAIAVAVDFGTATPIVVYPLDFVTAGRLSDTPTLPSSPPSAQTPARAPPSLIITSDFQVSPHAGPCRRDHRSQVPARHASQHTVPLGQRYRPLSSQPRPIRRRCARPPRSRLARHPTQTYRSQPRRRFRRPLRVALQHSRRPPRRHPLGALASPPYAGKPPARLPSGPFPQVARAPPHVVKSSPIVAT